MTKKNISVKSIHLSQEINSFPFSYVKSQPVVTSLKKKMKGGFPRNMYDRNYILI